MIYILLAEGPGVASEKKIWKKMRSFFSIFDLAYNIGHPGVSTKTCLVLL